MWYWKSRKGRASAINALVTCIAAVGVIGSVDVLGVAAMGTLPVSGNVSALPQRWDMKVEPLAEVDLPTDARGAVAVSGQQAIQTTEKYWGMSDSDVDPTLGAVRELFSGNGRVQGRKVWIVTTNTAVMSQGPPTSKHFVTDKLCTVIDAATGHFLLAYTAGSKNYVDGG